MSRRAIGRSAAIACLALLAACDGDPGCVDRDLDGLGEGCEAGPDCDDTNAARGEDCDAVPPPDCVASPSATGCPCLVGSATDCYPGPPGTAGVGLCRAGRTRCVSGSWGLCEGSSAPRRELCDGQDQDCDGVADEGVLSPCGGCDPTCTGGAWGDPFVEAGEGLELTDRGDLTLARQTTASATVWAVNSEEATVSRIDSRAAVETARYATGDRSALALEPSRIAVDWNGDAWVANRAFDDVSSVVRVAGVPERCVDRDGDGTIESSAGPADVRPWGEDECVLAHVETGAPREVARALAIDGDRGLDGASGGNAWVGLHDGQAFVEVDGLRGVVLRRIETPGFSPYSAAFDPWGRLWAIDRDGLLARIDPSLEPPGVEVLEVPLSCWLVYGLAVDAEGRVAVTGFSCDTVTVHDPRTGTWSTVRTEPSPRGAAFDGADLWVAHTGGRVSRLGVAPLRVLSTRLLDGEGLSPLETVGIGADGLGHVWAISGRGGPGGVGLATRITTAAGSPVAQVPIGLSPHTQGDPTGLFLFGEPVPEASVTRVLEGCGVGEETEWLRVHVAGDPGTHGRIALEARHAESLSALPASEWQAVGAVPDERPPFALALPRGGVVELRVTLSVSARIGAPRLSRVGIEWLCPGPV
jgi:hypothetical protein